MIWTLNSLSRSNVKDSQQTPQSQKCSILRTVLPAIPLATGSGMSNTKMRPSFK
jgi:hypothetical protein